MEIEQAAMLQVMPVLSQRRVLDLACGTGRYSQIAYQHGAAQVISMDNSAAMLRAGSALMLPVESTMSNLPVAAATFDVIICALATGHLPPAHMRQAIAEMARVLVPGGEAVISDFHPRLYRSGGRRTFTAPDGKVFAVEHYPHTIEDYTNAITAAGMNITALLEPTAERDGKTMPAVLVIRCRR